MTDIRSHYNAWLAMPVEVFEAVEGKTDPLVKLLRAEEPLTKATREALALWLEGELPPKKPPRRPRSQRLYGDIPTQVWMHFAMQRYKRIASWLNKRGRLRGNANSLLAAVAKKDGVHEDALRNAVRVGPPRVPDVASDLREQFSAWKAQVK